MADTAHRLTDEKLEEMEKRLSAIYSRANKEIGNDGKSILLNRKSKLTNCKKPMNWQKKAAMQKKSKKPESPCLVQKKIEP